MYTEKVMKYFISPKNIGRIDDYDGLGKVENPNCGDAVCVYIKVKENKNSFNTKKYILEDIKVETFGCVAAIACSSAMTEMMIGKTLEEAMKLTREQIANYLDGLPYEKMLCSNLAADGLHLAISDYQKKLKLK